MIKKIFIRTMDSVWLYPTLISVASFALAMFVGWIDFSGLIRAESGVLWLFFTSVDLSITILSVITGSLLTMTVFTFSTTMVVLTTYSAQFSNRVVKNFLIDDTTMKTLGVFMGGFVYSIMALSNMRKVLLNDRLVISAMVGIVYVILCLVYFLKYINHVASYIQMNHLIERLSDEVSERIIKYKDFLASGKVSPHPPIEDNLQLLNINSKSSGYIQYIDYKKMNRIASESNVVIGLKKITGVFMVKGSTLFEVHSEVMTTDEDLEEKLLSCVIIGNEQTDLQDFIYSVSKISEIALRAISPGINDPNTACHCIKILGLLINDISMIDCGYLLTEDPEKEKLTSYVEIMDFNQLLYNSFYLLIHYGREDMSVILAIIKALSIILVDTTPNNQEIVLDFVDYLWSKISPTLKEGQDGHILEVKLKAMNYTKAL